MLLVSGFNLFGQWTNEENIFKKFSPLAFTFKYKENILIENFKIVQITWSYNIIQENNDFYLTGCSTGYNSKIVKVILPHEYTRLEENQYNLIGNDHCIILFDKSVKVVWKLNLADMESWKWQKLPSFINTEYLKKNELKRNKIDNVIVKIIPKSTTYVCLTSFGDIYEIPDRIDTQNCIGTVVDIDCGYEHTIAVTDKGRVYTWGNGRRCQLGHGDLNSYDDPVEVEALAGIIITKVKAGGWHCLALSNSGDLYTWGWNESGQLGIYNKDKTSVTSYPSPTIVDFYDEANNVLELNVRDISCGSRHSAILMYDNSLWTTGFNKYGQLGLSPDQNPFLKHYKQIIECDSNSSIICGPWTTVVVS